MLQVDSRKVRCGDTFVALNDKYIMDAIRAGASKVVVEHGSYDVETMVVKDTLEYFHNYLRKRLPKLKYIGVTGTNGKTTTCYLIWQLFRMLDIKCSYIGTLGFYIKDKVKDLNNTTPSSEELYNLIMESYNNDVKYIVMEVSSQALDQRRVDFIDYDYVIYTNLTQDHLDYHKTMDNYLQAKLKILKLLKGTIIINNDDSYSNYFKVDNSITYGKSNSDYKLTIKNNYFLLNNDVYKTKLIGEYNVYNLSSVIILFKLLNYDITDKINKLEPPKGRMQIIEYKDNKIIIDYAHTPDALENVLKSVSGYKITIIGCGGNRDSSKRPIMGDIATKYSNHVIFTSDNPRFENVDNIIIDMTNNITRDNYEIEKDRYSAIRRGISLLKSKDILLILGKGHEEYQIINDRKIHFSDYEVVNSIINEKIGK